MRLPVFTGSFLEPAQERPFLSGAAAGSGWRPEDHEHSLTASLARMQVLDTYMFHSFLKARLNGRMDAFARMDLDTQSEEDRCLTVCTAFWGLRAHVSQLY